MCVTISIHLGTSRVNRGGGSGGGRPIDGRGRHGGGSCHINKHFLKLRLGILFRLSFVRSALFDPLLLLLPSAVSRSECDQISPRGGGACAARAESTAGTS